MLLLLTTLAPAAWPAPAPELARPQAALGPVNSPARPLDAASAGVWASPPSCEGAAADLANYEMSVLQK